MTRTAPRLLLAFAAILLVTGAVAHFMAFNRAVAAIGASNLPAFFGNILKVFWLADSTTMLLLAAFFGLIGARPSAASPAAVAMIAAIPAALAALIYTFMGSFFAGHILVVVSASALVASRMLVSKGGILS